MDSSLSEKLLNWKPFTNTEKLPERQTQSTNQDTEIACDIVRILFSEINDCIQNDRSRKKLNMLEKGAISQLLGDRTLKGINDYINNMYSSDIKSLMDKLEANMSRRKHEKLPESCLGKMY